MSTSIKAKCKKSDEQMNIDKYRNNYKLNIKNVILKLGKNLF